MLWGIDGKKGGAGPEEGERAQGMQPPFLPLLPPQVHATLQQRQPGGKQM